MKRSISVPKSSSTVPTRFALLAHYFAIGSLLDSVCQLTGPYIITRDPACIYNYSLIVFSRLIGDIRNLRKIYNTREGVLWLELLLVREAAAAKNEEDGL